MSKGIEIPGWEEVSYTVDPYGCIDIRGEWPGRDNMLVLKKVPEKPKMPELEMGDCVDTYCGDACYIILTAISQERFKGAGNAGVLRELDAYDIAKVFRNGQLIWTR